MPEIFEKNMEALGKKEPGVKEYIKFRLEVSDKERIDERLGLEGFDRETVEYKGLDEKIEVITEEAWNGKPIFRVKKDNIDVYLSGKRVPEAIAVNWTKSLKKMPRSSYVVMFGIGNGDFLKEVVKVTKDTINILIYEPSLVILKNCLEQIDLTEVFEKREVQILTDVYGTTYNMRYFLAARMPYESMEFMRRYTLPNYAQLYEEEFKWFWNQMVYCANMGQVNYRTSTLFSHYMITNVLCNMKYLPDCCTTFQLVDYIPKGIPAIIVAAGPSLDKNVHELKRAKGKAIIVAVDSAVRPLVNAGVFPDLICIIDAIKPVELLKVDGTENIPIVSSTVASGAVLDYNKGRKLFYSEKLGIVQKAFDMNNIPFMTVHTGGSVATTAFSLMYMVGIDDIILVGQDLAYSGEQRYAKGSYDVLEDGALETGTLVVEGNYEKEITTGTDLKLYIDWYKTFIQGAKEYRKNLRVINATEGGAKIEGTEVMTLESAINELCTKEYDVEGIFKNMKPAFNKQQRAKVVDYLHKIEPGFRSIEVEAIKCRKCYDKIDHMADTGNISPKEYIQLLNKIKKHTKKINANYDLYNCIDVTLVHANMIMKKELLMDEESLLEEAKEISRKGKIYMKLVADCANLFASIAADTVSLVK